MPNYKKPKPNFTPNRALAEIASRLDATGWQWEFQRPDLGWAKAQATTHTALRVRVQVRGFPEGVGTLSIQLYRLELQTLAREPETQNRVRQILEDWRPTVPVNTMVEYQADEPNLAQIDEVWAGYKAILRPWVREALSVAHRVERLYAISSNEGSTAY